jgi:hypothetical protein
MTGIDWFEHGSVGVSGMNGRSLAASLIENKVKRLVWVFRSLCSLKSLKGREFRSVCIECFINF